MKMLPLCLLLVGAAAVERGPLLRDQADAMAAAIAYVTETELAPTTKVVLDSLRTAMDHPHRMLLIREVANRLQVRVVEGEDYCIAYPPDPLRPGYTGGAVRDGWAVVMSDFLEFSRNEAVVRVGVWRGSDTHSGFSLTVRVRRSREGWAATQTISASTGGCSPRR
jgi:hypothetical protein